MAKKKLRIISSFNYKGKDGQALQDKWIRFSPGEECPSLEPEEIERLIRDGAICEIDLYGENIISKKIINLMPEQIEHLFAKSPDKISQIVNSSDFSQETLARMLVYAERYKLPGAIVQVINSKIKGDGE